MAEDQPVRWSCLPFFAPVWIAVDEYDNSCPQCTGDDDECALLCLPCRCGSYCECILCGCGENLEQSGNEHCLPCFALRCRAGEQPLRSGLGRLFGERSFALAWRTDTEQLPAHLSRSGPYSERLYCWPPLCCKHPGVTVDDVLCAACNWCDNNCDRGDRDGAGFTAAQRREMAVVLMRGDRGDRNRCQSFEGDRPLAQVMDRNGATEFISPDDYRSMSNRSTSSEDDDDAARIDTVLRNGSGEKAPAP